jgi:hypothetical protein
VSPDGSGNVDLSGVFAGLSGAHTLAATAPAPLLTQGGNTLDNGSGGVVIKGGSLDGVTIGATTQAPSIRATTVTATNSVVLSGAGKPWLNEIGSISGTLTAGGQINNISMNDQVVAGNNTLWGLFVNQNVLSPATGPRTGIQGRIQVTSTGANTRGQALFVGVLGRAETGANLGGTSGTPLGSLWGANFYGAVTNAAATFLDQVFGCEVDISVPTGASTNSKIGLLITSAAGDAVRGTTDDTLLMLAKQSTATASFRQGVTFGRTAGNWPFASDSTLIGTLNPGAANIGIDFTGVTFTGPAIKVPAAVSLPTIIFNSSANESTGSGSAALGANCPAVTLTAPYKWEKVTTSDGSTGYMPVWK